MRGARIAWLGDWNSHFAMGPGVLALCESALRTCADLGGTVEFAVPDFSPDALWDMWLAHRAFLIGNYPRPGADGTARLALLGAPALFEVVMARTLPAERLFAATVAGTAWAAAVRNFLARYDFAVAPTAQVFPFDVETASPTEVGGRQMDTHHRCMGIVLPWTLARTPVMGLPAGFNAAGLPMRVRLSGPRHADREVPRMARAHERATGWVARRPPP